MSNYDLKHRKYTIAELTKGYKSGLYYLIPEELSIHGNAHWISRRKIYEFLESIGWTAQEYVDILFLNISDPIDRPKCLECGEYIRFGRGTISNAYHQCASIPMGEVSKFCSKACAGRYNSKHPEIRNSNPSLKKFYSEGGTYGRIFRNPEKYPKFMEKYWKMIEEFSANGGQFSRMYKNLDAYPKFKEAVEECWRNGSATGIMNSDPEKYSRSLQKMKDFYKSGGAFGVMWRNFDDYPSLRDVGLHNSKRGIHDSPKSGPQPYQSSFELEWYKKLDKDDTVLSYKTQPLRIPYEFNGSTHNYIPDVLVEYIDHQELQEIKPLLFVMDEVVQLKSNAAIGYCKSNNLLFRFVTEIEIFQ